MYVDFEYANRRLSDFGCIICSINSNSGEYEVDIGCDITFKNIDFSVNFIVMFDNLFTSI